MFILSLGNMRKTREEMRKSDKQEIMFLKNMAHKKVFFGFHYKFDVMNWLDEYEAIWGIQSFTL